VSNKKELEFAESLSKLSKEDFSRMAEGFYKVFFGLSEMIAGVVELRKIEEAGFPILDEDISDALSKLVESSELEKVIKKSDPELIAKMFSLMVKLTKLNRSLAKIDPKTTPLEELTKLSTDLRNIAENLRELGRILGESGEGG